MSCRWFSDFGDCINSIRISVPPRTGPGLSGDGWKI